MNKESRLWWGKVWRPQNEKKQVESFSDCWSRTSVGKGRLSVECVEEKRKEVEKISSSHVPSGIDLGLIG